MFRQYLQPKILAAKALSAFLAIAVSGIFCLCCFQPAKAADKTEHCPLAKTSHCKSAKKKTVETASKEKLDSNSSKCCELKLNIFTATLEKNNFPQPIPATANNLPTSFEFKSLENKAKAIKFVYRPPIYDYGNLHIKNCVFRI